MHKPATIHHNINHTASLSLMYFHAQSNNAFFTIAAYNYAKKKTKKTISISLSALEGAGIMNNTFCLAIFLLIIFVKKLAWTFTAECIAILLVELYVGLIALKRVQMMYDAVLVVLAFPASLVLVWVLENVAHLK